MRPSSLATALIAFSAGVTATVAARRLAARHRAPEAPRTPAEPGSGPVVPAPEQDDAVVLPFARPALAAVPAAPARCGDNGGLTRAGAPCGARATATGRCHHHPIAA
jgi:hypothetical protein